MVVKGFVFFFKATPIPSANLPGGVYRGVAIGRGGLHGAVIMDKISEKGSSSRVK